MNKHFRFATHFHTRDEGVEGPRYVLHAIPGNLTAGGETREEAWANFDALIDCMAEKLGEEGSKKWFDAVHDRMSDEEEALWEWVMKPQPKSVSRDTKHASYVTRESSRGGRCAVL